MQRIPHQILSQAAQISAAPAPRLGATVPEAPPHRRSSVSEPAVCRRPDALVLALLLGLLLVLLGEPLATGRLIIGHDMDQPYNWEAFNRLAFRAGGLPLWNPYVFSGFPAQADIQTAVFYPPHWLLRPLPLSLEAFFMWSLTAHLWLLGAGGYALARQVGASRPASFAAATGIMLGGITAPRVFAGQLLLINGFAWLPLALTLGLRSLAGRSFFPRPSLVLVLVTQFLAGAAQPSLYTIAALGALAGYASLRPQTPVSSLRDRVRPLIQFSSVAVLFVLLAAFQILPMLALQQEAGRGGGLPYSRSSKGAVVPEHLLTVFLPNLFSSYATDFQDGFSGGIWEKSPYAGFLLAAAAPFAALDRRRRWVVTFLALLALITLAFAMAEHLPFFWIHHLVLRGIRGPGRLMALWVVSFAVLGALGLDALTSRPGLHRWRGALIGLATVVLLVSAATLVWQGIPELAGRSWADWRITRAAGPLVILTALLALGYLVWRRSSPVQAIMAIAPGLVALDLTLFAGQFFTISGPGRNEELARTLSAEGAQRVLSVCTGELSSPAMMNLAVPSPDGYNSSYLRNYGDFASLVRGEPVGAPGPTFPKFGELRVLKQVDYLRFLSVSHVLACEDPGAPFERVYASEKWQLYRNAGPMPRAVWSCEPVGAGSNAEAARVISDQSLDLARQAVVSRRATDLPLTIGDRCGDGARLDILTIDRPDGYMAVDVTAPGDGLLVINDAYYRERQARLDGQPVETLRADLAFTAIAVPQGEHRVELAFVPRTLMIGAYVSAATLALWTTAVLLLARRKRTQPRLG